MPAFASTDARLVRACIFLLDAAWRSPQPGSLPSDVALIAGLARLPACDVERYWEQLFQGWELREDGRLWHPRLSKLATDMAERYSDELGLIESSLVLMQQPVADLFDTVVPAKAASGAKGKRALPKAFEPDRVSSEAMRRAGFLHQPEREWLLAKFVDFAEGRRYVNWQAAFRNYLSNSITAKDFQEHFGYRLRDNLAPSRGVIQPPMSSTDRLRSFVHGAAHGASRPQQHPAPLADTPDQRRLSNARVLMAEAAAARGLLGGTGGDGG